MGLEDDLPARRYREEPVKSGPFKGYLCEPDKWGRMLDDFYEIQGLDKTTGRLLRGALAGLGMADVARKLAKA
jgi:aldehyde:ferredoxin oxidoreductase